MDTRCYESLEDKTYTTEEPLAPPQWHYLLSELSFAYVLVNKLVQVSTTTAA